MSHSEKGMYLWGMMMHRIKNIMGAASILLGFATAANAAQESGEGFLVATENCFAIGQSIAANRGVTLVAAEDAVQNGQKVCKVVVLAPATNGGRPKREILFIPQ
jgi:hypothetical protein